MSVGDIANINKLSPREREVAMLILGGVATTIIADKLGVKTNTISTLKKKIFLKLNVDSEVGLYKLLLG
jgi:DNA-binding CsgD family transcriptional regulator